MTFDKERYLKETIHKDMIRNLYSGQLLKTGNMFLTKVTDRGLISRLYKDFLPISKEKDSQIVKWPECKVI